MRHFIYKDSDFERLSEEILSLDDISAEKGVFETLRVYGGKVFLLEAHLRRFYSGANKLKIITPPIPPMNDLQQILIELLDKFENTKVLRFLATQAYDKMVFSIDDKDRYSPSQYETGLKLSVDYIDSLKRDPARKELKLMGLLKLKEAAMERGFDDSILLSSRGLVTDTAVANIFWVKDGKVFTPSAEVCLLNGVTRQFIIRMSPKMGLKISEAEYSLEHLMSADEVFMTNSVMEIMPVVLVEAGKKKVSFSIGPVTKKLMAFYYAVRSRQAAPPQPDSSTKLLRSLLDQ